jgi:hypothetical protein
MNCQQEAIKTAATTTTTTTNYLTDMYIDRIVAFECI